MDYIRTPKSDTRRSGMVRLLLLITIIVSGGASVAQAGPMFTLGLASGGDKLAERTDGASLEAGGGVTFELGMEISQPEDPLVFQFLIGTKFDSLTGTSGGVSTTAKISSMPLHALVMLRSDRLLLGGGLAYYMNPSYDPPFSGSSTVNFSNSSGFALEADFAATPRMYVGLRYTSMKLKGATLIDTSGKIYNELDASSVALMLGIKLN